jgi:hypothetical protein
MTPVQNPPPGVLRAGIVTAGLATVGIAGVALGVHERRKARQQNPETVHVVTAAVGTGFLTWVGMLVWCSHQLGKFGKTYADIPR